MNDVVLNRKASIDRCIDQIRAYYALDSGVPFEQDHLKQDAIAMNLQRICELAIDIANHWIKSEKIGLPKDSAQAFELLVEARRIPADLGANLKRMVGFRNILVHEYTKLDQDLMVRIVEEHLGEPQCFAALAVSKLSG